MPILKFVAKYQSRAVAHVEFNTGAGCWGLLTAFVSPHWCLWKCFCKRLPSCWSWAPFCWMFAVCLSQWQSGQKRANISPNKTNTARPSRIGSDQTIPDQTKSDQTITITIIYPWLQIGNKKRYIDGSNRKRVVKHFFNPSPSLGGFWYV